MGAEDDAEDDLDDPNEVYAVSTVISLTEKQKESVAGIRKFLLEQTAKGGDRQVLQYMTGLLNQNVGFLINERFINIPAQITVPLWETLVTEMRKARDRNLPFDFGHYIMICKLYKSKTEAPNSHQQQQAVVFANPEEELIVAESELCIDYEVEPSEDDDAALGTEGMEMKPWRSDCLVYRISQHFSLLLVSTLCWLATQLSALPSRYGRRKPLRLEKLWLLFCAPG